MEAIFLMQKYLCAIVALTFYLLLKQDDKMNDQPIPPSPLNVKLSPTPYRLKHSLG